MRVGKDKNLKPITNEPICPLRSIHFVAGETNMWANIQKYDLPVMMDFDFDNPKKWMSYHKKNVDKMLHC